MVLNARALDAEEKTTRSDEAMNRSRNVIREAGRLLITGLFERDKVARINSPGWPASQVGFSLSFPPTSLSLSFSSHPHRLDANEEARNLPCVAACLPA